MAEYVRPRTPAEADAFFDQELRELPAPQEGWGREAELAGVQVLLETHEWRYAKTMPQHPHWYTLIDRHDWDAEEFYRCVQAIRLYGARVMWGRWPYVELVLGDYLYWTMGYPVRGTTLINRKPVK